ncbi:MAG TPA: redoxin domain-containing protein [Fimbriimonadaceae bacterium]|nr:redoxin domain-containing protein [Fimbriimonadaceae bacterium]HRJ97740.1 redoxin domain-containing protein [Fimbriimonadaceae bacterium]
MLARTSIFLCLLCLCAAVRADDDKFGHSKHGTAFDSGMRTKPWKMDGIGTSPFPISTRNPEVQEWYDQGNALLHSFWFEEAERSFRWCLKLEAGNAMVYFGLARCGLNWFSTGAGESPELQRYRDFLKEAVRRKSRVSERERLYIEAWDAAWAKQGDEARRAIIGHLEQLCVKYPDDIEAKTQLAFFNIGQGSALANEFLIQKVLAVNPMHPGAHHARIHNWDGVSGAQAVASCERYGKAAPGIGHSLHMPGHIYTKIGMWHEAAIAMDSATRVELSYMNNRLALPFETWNYAHNRDYLCYIQEQLGRAEASIQGALDMHNAPRDPSAGGRGYPAIIPLLRALVKFERWDRILDGKTLFDPGDEYLAQYKVAAEVMALVGTGKTSEARKKMDEFKAEGAKKLESEIAKAPDRAEAIRNEAEKNAPKLVKVAGAQLLLAEGKRDEGMKILTQLAESESGHPYGGDPPGDPWPVARLVGDAYFGAGEYGNAIEAYERGLSQEINDAWCIAGLAKSHAALGDKDKARPYAARFFAVWDGADPGLRWMKEVQALDLKAKPFAETYKPERRYDPKALDRIGPSNWQPFAAPALHCLDVEGKVVTLEQYRGKNVLLIYYLSDQCVHCIEQLTKVTSKIAEFDAMDTVVLAVSAAKPEVNKASGLLAAFKIALLSDPDHSNARRFASFDDFEDMELHSTILIDRQGRVRWKRTGGEPFADVDFLLSELKRWSGK